MNYVMELQEFPDGLPLNTTDKAVAFVLAHHHNPEHRTMYPGLPSIARAACCSMSTAKRTLTGMERHFLIGRLRPKNQGRGQFTKYCFLALDAPHALELLLRGEKLTEGLQFEPLFFAEKRGSKEVHSETKRGSKGVQNRTRNKERTGTDTELDLTTTSNIPVEVAEIDREALRAALSEWLGINGRQTRKAVVDDVVLQKLVDRCVEADPRVCTNDILHFIDEKGPSLLEKRPTDYGYISVQKAEIQYPAMFLVAAVTSCFHGPNSASRKRRLETAGHTR